MVFKRRHEVTWEKLRLTSVITQISFQNTKGKKKPSAEGQSPQQELEVGPHSGPYLLVLSYIRKGKYRPAPPPPPVSRSGKAGWAGEHRENRENIFFFWKKKIFIKFSDFLRFFFLRFFGIFGDFFLRILLDWRALV